MFKFGYKMEFYLFLVCHTEKFFSFNDFFSSTRAFRQYNTNFSISGGSSNALCRQEVDVAWVCAESLVRMGHKCGLHLEKCVWWIGIRIGESRYTFVLHTRLASEELPADKEDSVTKKKRPCWGETVCTGWWWGERGREYTQKKMEF